MFFDLDIKGNLLPPKTICLTYDDGPGATVGPGAGPRTRELGHYLFEQGIGATFFVIGRHVEQHPGLIEQLQAWGHLIGNHTYSHPGLVSVATRGGDVIGEIAKTEALIHKAVTGPVTFLRAPYGNWREKVSPDSDVDKRTSIVAELLNQSGRFPHYVGPINWDISSLDWEFWGRGDSAAQCATNCLACIEQKGSGLLLMHDSSENASVRAQNRTEETTRLLVPMLRERGYHFIRLDAIPQVQSAIRVSALVSLRAPTGRFLVRAADDTFHVKPPIPNPVAQEESFGLTPFANDLIALRTSTGQYVTVADEGGALCAGPVVAGQQETFRLEKRGAEQVALRTADGFYVTRAPNDQWRADEQRCGDREILLLHRRA